MAALRAPYLSVLSATLSNRIPTMLPLVPNRASFTRNFLPSLLALATSPAYQLRIPSLISDLWESVLRAVPKKKTSHRKKRQRFLAGKALKDVTALNKCPGCGNTKRMHLLCPYCVREIRDMWLGRGNSTTKEADSTASKES